jgi:hypothetical protein
MCSAVTYEKENSTRIGGSFHFMMSYRARMLEPPFDCIADSDVLSAPLLFRAKAFPEPR